MSADNTQQIKDRLIDAALSVAAQYSWDDVSMIDIAAKANIDLIDAQAIYETKADVITGFGRRLDRKVADNLGDFRHDETCRDRLFDIFMERYEQLNEHRNAIAAWFCTIKSDPKSALTALPHLHQSIQSMMDLADMQSSGLRGAMRLAGLSTVYLHGVYNLLHDDSADLAKVMAALDKDLNRVEGLANLFSV